MKKKNSLPIKWMLIIMISLMAVVYCTNQTSRNIASPQISSFSSPAHFIQFLMSLFGVHSQYLSSNETADGNLPNQHHQNSRHMAGGNEASQENPNLITMAMGLLSPTSNNSKKEKNSGNSWVNNPNDTAEMNADQALKDLAEINNPNNSLNNEERNLNNAQDNSALNADDSSVMNVEFNPANNSAVNAENNLVDTSGNPLSSGDNSGSPSGNNPAGSSGYNPAGAGGNNPTGNSGSSSGSNSINFNQSNLPTLNPIPTDTQVSQSIARQNQQDTALSTLLASRKALVAPVIQEAQVSKYQTVSSQNIPAPSTNQAPADIAQKVQSRQLSLH